MRVIDKVLSGRDLTSKVQSSRIRKAGGKYSDIYVCRTNDGAYVAVKQFRFANDEDAHTFTEASHAL